MFVSPPTSTTLAQRDVELKLLQFLQQYYFGANVQWSERSQVPSAEASDCNDNKCDLYANDGTQLHRVLHEIYVKNKLLSLSESEEGLYNAQPWIVYWTLHAADVLGITDQLYEDILPDALGDFLFGCLQELKKDAGGDVWRPAKVTPLWHNGDIFDASCADDGESFAGFAGGQLAQFPHLGVSYAAVCSLCILARPEYLRALPRAAIKRWLLSLRNNDGSFCMHNGGEADIRGSYCAAVINVLLQLDEVAAYKDGRPDAVLTEHTAMFVALCQTHEGGFACGQNASEAHGAYTHCALASLMLMRRPHLCNYARLRRWLAARQLKFEGGFNGRTNKIVDSCYSYWVGVSHVLLQVGEAYKALLGNTETSRCQTARELLLLDHAQLIDVTCIYHVDEEAWFKAEETQQQHEARVEKYIQEMPAPSTSLCHFLDKPMGDFYFNQQRLLLYVLSCCQNTRFGGLMDKPEFPNDSYHTCYSLSGMSAVQNLQYLPRNSSCDKSIYSIALSHGYIPKAQENYGVVLVTNDKSESVVEENYECLEQLCPVNPIFNICRGRVLAGLRAWGPKSFLF